MADSILLNPLYLLKRLPYQEVQKLHRMVHAEDHSILEREQFTWDCITKIGLTDTVWDANFNRNFIYPDLVEALKPVIDGYMESLLPDSKKVRNEKLVTGLLNLYGILTIGELEELCRQADPELTPDLLHQVLAGSYLFQSQIRQVKERVVITSPHLFGDERIQEEIEARKSLKRARFAAEVIRASGDSENPQPPDSKEVAEFRNMVRKTLQTDESSFHSVEEEISDWISDLWILINNDLDALQHFLKFFENYPVSQEQLETVIKVFMNFLNSLPRWIMKGNSSKVVWERYEKHEMMEKPPQLIIGPNATKAGINVPQEEFNKLWEQTVKKPSPNVGRNDPCPCGSGKKFKHCCQLSMN